MLKHIIRIGHKLNMSFIVGFFITLITFNAQAFDRSPQDIMTSFIEKWNEAKNIEDLTQLLKFSSKETALIRKFTVAAKIKKQKLPQARFNEATSMVYFNNSKMQILSFAPLTLFVDNKILFFNQEKDEDRIDYLIKEYLSSTKKNVFFQILIPSVYAESFFGDYKAMFYTMGAITAATSIWGAWSNAKQSKVENEKKVAQAAPIYTALQNKSKTNDPTTAHKIFNFSCKEAKLENLAVYKNKDEVYSLKFDSTNANIPTELTIEFPLRLQPKTNCVFTNSNDAWITKKGNNESCTLPTSKPSANFDFMPVEEFKKCCADTTEYCKQWISSDILGTKLEGKPNTAVDGSKGSDSPTKSSK